MVPLLQSIQPAEFWTEHPWLDTTSPSYASTSIGTKSHVSIETRRRPAGTREDQLFSPRKGENGQRWGKTAQASSPVQTPKATAELVAKTIAAEHNPPRKTATTAMTRWSRDLTSLKANNLGSATSSHHTVVNTTLVPNWATHGGPGVSLKASGRAWRA